MSDDGFKLQISLKYGPRDDRGNPTSMLNVRANSPAELSVLVQTLRVEDLVDLQKHLDAATVVHSVMEGGPSAPPSNVVPFGPPPETRSCAHGQMIHRKGVKNGRPYEGWTCPLPKGSSGTCEPIWLNS